MPIDARRLTPRIGWLLVVGVMFLLFGFGSTPASGNLVASPWDKLVHLGVFAALATGLGIVFPRLPWLPLFLFAAGIGAADELHQFWVPTRQPDWDDALADVTGIACGMLLLCHFKGLRPAS